MYSVIIASLTRLSWVNSSKISRRSDLVNRTLENLNVTVPQGLPDFQIKDTLYSDSRDLTKTNSSAPA